MIVRSSTERRVVITGAGLVSPLGYGVGANWRGLLEATPNFQLERRKISGTVSDFVVSRVPEQASQDGVYHLDAFFTVRERRRFDRFIQLGIVAADEAVRQACLDRLSPVVRERVAVHIGSGVGGLQTIAESASTAEERRRPFFLPSVLINSCASEVAIRHGFKGGASGSSASCSTATLAIGQALRSIRHGYSDIVIAGGSEAPVTSAGLKVFSDLNALARPDGQDPSTVSRPWDKNRSGFVMAEGSGVLVLEELDHARARGVKILGEITGFGESADASDLVSPDHHGLGAEQAMFRTLHDAGWEPDDVDWINAHATGTPLGDDVELVAMERVFGERSQSPFVSSTKGVTGHLLGAAGAMELIFCLCAMHNGIIPPTRNLENPSSISVLKRPRDAVFSPATRCLSNSFGFGGVNGCLAVQSVGYLL